MGLWGELKTLHPSAERSLTLHTALPGGCRSWYLDVNGADTDLIWPGSADEYLSRTRRVDMRKWALRDEVGKPLRYKGPGGHFGRRLAGLSSLLPEAK